LAAWSLRLRLPQAAMQLSCLNSSQPMRATTLWTVMAFLVFGFVFSSWSTARVSAAALLLSYADEVTQLYHAPWIDSVRGT
jgi:Protein of unknown function (DUF2809)